MTPEEKLRLFRRVAAATAVVAALTALFVLWLKSPEWKTWLFDLSVAAVLAGAAHLLGQRLIAGEAEHRRRVLAAIVCGVTAASAGLGIFAITLQGPPEGLQHLPGLVVIQLLGALGGAAIGFFTSLAMTVVVRALGQFFACSRPALDGAVAGALSGTLGGALFLGFPHLSWWFVLVSAGVCSLSGMRAGAYFADTCGDRVMS